MGDVVAIYCTQCSADMSIFKEDVHGMQYTDEELFTIVAKQWNFRNWDEKTDDVEKLHRQLQEQCEKVMVLERDLRLRDQDIDRLTKFAKEDFNAAKEDFLTPETAEFARQIAKDGIDWHHSASLMKQKCQEMERRYKNFRILTQAAFHALRAYENGNASPDLAKSVADSIQEAL